MKRYKLEIKDGSTQMVKEVLSLLGDNDLVAVRKNRNTIIVQRSYISQARFLLNLKYLSK